MNDSLQLYEINKEIQEIIETCVDEETGEISQEAEERFSKLQLKREDIIHSVGLSYFQNQAKSEAVMNEIRRLQAIKKQFDSKQNTCERLIKKTVKLGEEFKFENLQIKWKKNPPKVVTDDLLDLNEVQSSFPELVKVEYSLDKNLVKQYAKDGKPLPEGIKTVQDFSLTIK